MINSPDVQSVFFRQPLKIFSVTVEVESSLGEKRRKWRKEY